jgi:hypothetical protein
VGACWGGFSDAESGIVEYRWLAGWKNASHGLGQMMAATSAGLETSAMLEVVSYDRHAVSHAQDLIRVLVIAYSCAGLSTTASSDGILVDPFPPGVSRAWVYEVGVQGGIVLADLCVDPNYSSNLTDISYQSSPTISVCWGGFDDVRSGVAQYLVGTGWSWQNHSNLTRWSLLDPLVHMVTDNTSLTEVLAPSQHFSVRMNGTESGEPPAGAVFHSWVQAINRAQLMSAVVRSNGVVFDPTPPISGIVHDVFLPGDADSQTSDTATSRAAALEMEMRMGDMKDLNCQPSNNSISAQWERFADVESSIAFFEWAIGSSPYGEELQPFTRLAPAMASASNHKLFLEVGATYYTTVRATNFADLSSTSTSNGVVISPHYAIDFEVCVPSMNAQAAGIHA